MKSNAQSEGKPNSVPGKPNGISERSDAGKLIVPEPFGFVKIDVARIVPKRSGGNTAEARIGDWGKGRQSLSPA